MDMVAKNRDTAHIPLAEAFEILLSAFAGKSCGEEYIDVPESLGLILACDVVSERNVPHYTASAVDGYAIKAIATAGATSATPITLSPCEYEWVNTGMPIKAADSVIMVEDTSIEHRDGADILTIFKSVTQGENVRAVGEDVMRGQMLAFAGDRVTPALVSLFLCAGLHRVLVRIRPRTLFIPTGDEIGNRDEWLSDRATPPGLVVDSNSEYASALFAEWGYDLDVHQILPDRPDIIKAALLKAAESYDLVLLSAGSAKGRRDHSADIFNELGEMLFRYVRMKPGRPVMAAKIADTPVICTPGFPMSCAVVLWSLVYPILKSLSGEPVAKDYIAESIGSHGSVGASFLVQHTSPPGIAEWLRVKLALVGDDTFFWPLGAGASVLWALAESDGIALIEESGMEFVKGSKLQILLTKNDDLRKRLLFQGSDDPAIQLLISFVRRRGMDFVIRAVGSMGGLAALARGEAHFAAAHLLNPDDGLYNTSYIEQFAAGREWGRRLVFHREQGLIVAPGNPKNIKKFSDLASGDIVFENRQPGAGTRVLTDYMLKCAGINSSAIKGYSRQSITHMEAANKVASGVADVTLGIKAAADALYLDFVPVAHEPYELVFGEGFDEHIASSALFEALECKEWRDAVSRMGGYEWI